MSRRVNQRWPDGLFERVEAAAAALDGCSVTDLTVSAVQHWVDWAEGSRSAPSSEAPKQEAPPLPGAMTERRATPAKPRPRAVETDWPAAAFKAASSSKVTQGPTCSSCGGLATYVKGKPRCMAGCKR